MWVALQPCAGSRHSFDLQVHVVCLLQCMPATCQLYRLVCISGNISIWRPRLQRAKVCHVATVLAEVGLMVLKLLLATAVTQHHDTMLNRVQICRLTLACYADTAGAGVSKVLTRATACYLSDDSPSPVWGCDQSCWAGSSAGKVGGWACTRCAAYARNMQPYTTFAKVCFTVNSLPLHDTCSVTVSNFAFAAMEWSEGDNWSLEVDLSPGVTDFKCAVVRQNGSVVCWEPGANRTVEVR